MIIRREFVRRFEIVVQRRVTSPRIAAYRRSDRAGGKLRNHLMVKHFGAFLRPYHEICESGLFGQRDGVVNIRAVEWWQDLNFYRVI